MESTTAFLHLIFGAFVALLPPVNPVGAAWIVDPFFRGARITSAPFTAFVLVLEMTNRQTAILPMMLSTLIAYTAAKDGLSASQRGTWMPTAIPTRYSLSRSEAR
jgi:H+/Cl- antiporter ClcA